MWSLLSRLFRSRKASTCQPRPRPPRYRGKEATARPPALLDVLGWQPPMPVNREAVVGRPPRVP